MKNILKTNKLVKIVTALVCITVLVLLYSLTIQPKSSGDNVADDVSEPMLKTEYENAVKEWNNNHSINKDYVGMIGFDSGLLNVPFVKPDVTDLTQYPLFDENGVGTTDYDEGCKGMACTFYDVYTYMDWQTMKYDLKGSVYLDPRNEMDNQNLILYGHHFAPSYDPDCSIQFTPLEKLLKENAYEENKSLKLYLENEVREYEVAVVYIFNGNYIESNDFDDLQFQRTYYGISMNYEEDPDYEQTYIDNVNKVKLYETGVDLEVGDTTLTLQTCITHQPYLRQIVVCKLINTINYYE